MSNSSSLQAQKPIHKQIASQRGAMMLEFALVAALVFALIMVFIDASRYLLFQSVLTRAAEQAVNVAKKDIRFCQDVRTISSPTLAALDDFRNARREIAQVSLSLPSKILYPSANGAKHSVLEFKVPDPQYGSSPATGSESLDAALFFPGQIVEYRTKDQGGSVVWNQVPHPTCVNCPEATEPGPKGWKELLKNHPMVMEVRGTMPLLSLLGQRVDLVGRSAAFQECVPVGSPGVLPTPTPTPTASPNIPCSQIGETAACSGKCLSPNQRCVFLPNNTTPNCNTCADKRCGDWTTEQAWCAGNCEDRGCNFDPNGLGNNCGTCAPQLCSDWKSESEFCAGLNCEALGDTHTCAYAGWYYAPNCGQCVPKTCAEWKPQTQYCQELNCEAQSSYMRCAYASWYNAPNCGECVPKRCDEWKPKSQFCDELNCEAQGDTSICVYNPWENAPNCGACRTKRCDEWKSQAQYCAEQNCEAQGKVCNYQFYENAPNCGGCRTAQCSEAYTKEEYCATQNCSAQQTCDFFGNYWAPDCGGCRTAYCGEIYNATDFCNQLNCQAQGPYKKCNFYSNHQPPSCGQCVDMACIDWKSQSDYCKNVAGCTQPWQTCNYSPGAIAPNCGTGCVNASCSFWTNKQTACSNVTCPAGQVCEFLPGNSGQNCTTCRPLTCNEVPNSYSNSCQAINCTGQGDICTINYNSTNLSTCDATCQRQSCASYTQSQACPAGACPQGQSCQLNTGGIPPNCRTCSNQTCGQFTNEAQACSSCPPTHTCSWFPNSVPPFCSQCTPPNVCPDPGCPLGEIWDPLICECRGAN